MPVQSNSLRRVEEIHAAFLKLGQTRVSRDDWDRILLKTYGFSLERAGQITKAGELLGFWTRHRGKPVQGQGSNPGYITVHAPKPMAQANEVNVLGQ